MSKTSTAALCAALGFLACQAAAQDAQAQTPAQMVDANRVVLVFNGEEIRGAEYYRRMEYLDDVGMVVGKQFKVAPPGFLTIQKLINERLAFGLAKEKGVYPTDAEVQDEMNIRLAENPKMLEEWVGGGGNIDELKYQVRLQIAQFKLQTFGITVTDSEVEDQYNNHPDIYTTPKRLKLRLIAVGSSDDTKAVDQDLAAGKDFAAEAKDKSIDISKSIGGEQGTVDEDSLDPVARDAISAIKIGQTTKWLSTTPHGGSGTYLKFYLEDVIPAKKLELDDKL